MQPEPEQMSTDQALPQNSVDQADPTPQTAVEDTTSMTAAPVENPEQPSKLDPALAQPVNKPVTKTTRNNHQVTIAIIATVIIVIALAVLAVYAYKKG